LVALTVVLAFSLGAATAPAGDLPPAEKVLAKYAEAIGGEALEKVKSYSAQAEFEMPMQGVYADAEEAWKKPGSYHFRIDLASVGVPDFETGVVDGVAWQSHPMAGTRKLEGAEAAALVRQAALNPYADWKSQFETVETVAEETVGEAACYKVVFTPAEGEPMSAFFDKETGLAVQQEVMGPTGIAIVTKMSDYQETQGILSPRSVEVEGPESYGLKYTAIEYDVDDIPEDTFELPASLK
jgi:hypothetical protein